MFRHADEIAEAIRLFADFPSVYQCQPYRAAANMGDRTDEAAIGEAEPIVET